MFEPMEAKVGDKLFVKGGSYDKGHIEVVERVTPTGRIITMHAQYNPDGLRRGDSGSWTRTRARIATEDDLAGIYRFGLVSKIENFKNWNKLSAEDLVAAADLVAKYQLPGQ